MNKSNKFLLIAVFFGFLFFNSCSDDPAPSIYDSVIPDVVADPIINSISPQSPVLAGITNLTITGQNFSTVLTDDEVYFNGVAGEVISATSTEIIVKTPNVVADSVGIKVKVHKAINFSNNIKYTVLTAIEKRFLFDLTKNEYPYALTVDQSENVFVFLKDKGIKKIDSQGTLTDFAPVSGAVALFRSMTIASDNAIYGVKGGVKGIYRVVENTAPVAFVSSSQGITDNINSVNFDESRNVIWAGGSTGIIYRVTLDKNVKKFTHTGTINSCKVAQNSLFVLSTTNGKETIWRFSIISADSLGVGELYFDFSTNVDPTLKINDFVVAQDGNIYLGAYIFLNPIYVVHPDKSFEVHYPELIESAAYSLVWGYGDYLYMSDITKDKDNLDVNTHLYMINMQKLGAH
jgi:hypothetical protein